MTRAGWLRPSLAALVSLPVLGACATNPATGQREIMLVSEEQEVALGRQDRVTPNRWERRATWISPS